MKPLKYEVTVDGDCVTMRILDQPKEWTAKTEEQRKELVWISKETGFIVQSAGHPEFSGSTIFLRGTNKEEDYHYVEDFFGDEDLATDYADRVRRTLDLFNIYLSTLDDVQPNFFD